LREGAKTRVDPLGRKLTWPPTRPQAAVMPGQDKCALLLCIWRPVRTLAHLALRPILQLASCILHLTSRLSPLTSHLSANTTTMRASTVGSTLLLLASAVVAQETSEGVLTIQTSTPTGTATCLEVCIQEPCYACAHFTGAAAVE
jgi:hypothetical protein